MPFALCFAFVAAASAVKTSIRGAQPTDSSVHAVRAYEAFRRKFSVERSHEDHSAYHSRVSLFERRSQEVEAHNAQPQLGWVKAVNKFADYTDAEFHAMLGHRLSKRGRAAGMPAPAVAASLMQLQPEHELAMAVDWRQKLNLSMTAKDQGSCGSCWAVAAAGAMETHSEMAGQAAPEISYEQLVDCVENTEECGGTGGCHGATAELAFAYIAKHGVALKKDYKGYQSHGDGRCRPPSHAALTAKSFVRVQENEARPLREAVSMHGPVVVAADAGGWSSYGGGVFAGCGKDAVINHAILLVGYGTDDKSKKDFWSIRNSWGADWGEAGFIRILRHKDDESYCGVDHKPLDGVGCKGGPATLPVCGMCGILSDSAYPTDVAMA